MIDDEGARRRRVLAGNGIGTCFLQSLPWPMECQAVAFVCQIVVDALDTILCEFPTAGNSLLDRYTIPLEKY